eukprot:m.205007 g.205007  ORF g.205007 m.205007 type:complete len:50 (+) comp39654_c0_seq51:2701-2850(+)
MANSMKMKSLLEVENGLDGLPQRNKSIFLGSVYVKKALSYIIVPKAPDK